MANKFPFYMAALVLLASMGVVPRSYTPKSEEHVYHPKLEFTYSSLEDITKRGISSGIEGIPRLNIFPPSYVLKEASKSEESIKIPLAFSASAENIAEVPTPYNSVEQDSLLYAEVKERADLYMNVESNSNLLKKVFDRAMSHLNIKEEILNSIPLVTRVSIASFESNGDPKSISRNGYDVGIFHYINGEDTSAFKPSEESPSSRFNSIK